MFSTFCNLQQFSALQGLQFIIERFIAYRLRKLNGIKIMGKPLMSVVAFTSDKFDIYQLSENLNKRGWSLNNLQFPARYNL